MGGVRCESEKKVNLPSNVFPSLSSNPLLFEVMVAASNPNCDKISVFIYFMFFFFFPQHFFFFAFTHLLSIISVCILSIV
jgi:hypothetical protein